MNNLYIMHTQYNLILACGLALNHPKDTHALILFPEFTVTEEIINNLRKVFSPIVVLRKGFENVSFGFTAIFENRKYLKKTKFLWKQSFDYIYISQDRDFETYFLSRASKINKFKCCYIEDDAYYSLNPEKNNPALVEFKPGLHYIFGNFIRTLFLGKNLYLERGHCYGMNSHIKDIFVIFPNLVRKELNDKHKHEITVQQLAQGIDVLYGNRNTVYPKNNKYFLVFFDLLERYREKDLIINLSQRAIENAIAEGYSVLIKYHPRETEKFTCLKDITEINQLVPAEKILYDLKNKNTIVFCNATTAGWIAAKMGITVFSTAKLENPDNSTMHKQLVKMGIHIINLIN